MLSLNQNESRALFNENQQLKERIRLLEVQRDPMEMSRDNIRNQDFKGKRGRSQNSSKNNTQNVNTREILKAMDERGLLERQVDEYKTALLSQSQLINNLRDVIYQQQLKLEEQKIGSQLQETLSESLRQTSGYETKHTMEQPSSIERPLCEDYNSRPKT